VTGESAAEATRMPLVSIVTPSFNMARYLPETIESVLSQDYPHIEYRILDCGSTDGTEQLLERYAGRLQYRIAPDNGPADAISRGLAEAQGDFVTWLNADDTYEPGAIQAAVSYLLEHPDIDVVYGQGYWMDERGKRIRAYPNIPFDSVVLAKDCFICQPASLIRADAYRRCGLDPAVDISFDYDLWIRMSGRNFRFAFLPAFQANSRVHRESLSLKDRGRVFKDSMALLKRHYGYVPLSWIFGYAAFCSDGRDQFLEPLQPTVQKYLASLPMGLRYNPEHKIRFLREWTGTAMREMGRRLFG
jgi:glycosyltransferase involved in cell wall biosynthesis